MEIDKLFGSKTAARCLIFLSRYEECTSGEIAQVFKIDKPVVYLQLKKLEQANIIVSRMVGNTKLYSLNPRSGIKNELKALLEKYIDLNMPMEKYKSFYLIRRRPRKTGKVLKGTYAK